MIPVRPGRRFLGKLPPLLDGYEAIARAIAQGDVDHAFTLARQFHKSAQPVKRDAVAIGRQMDLRRRRKNA